MDEDEMQETPDFSDVESGSSSRTAAADSPKTGGYSGLAKVGKTVGRAATGVVQELAEVGAAGVDLVAGKPEAGLSDLVTGESLSRAQKVERAGNELRRQAFGDKEQGAWGMAEDITQFGMSMAIPTGWLGKLPRIGKAIKAAPRAAKIVLAEAKVEAKAALGLDPVEQNFANLLAQIPALSNNSVVNALKSEGNTLQDRGENFVSGMIVGGIVGTAFKAVRGTYRLFGSKFAQQATAAEQWVAAKAAHRAGKLSDEGLNKVAGEVEAALDKAQSGTFTDDNVRRGLADYRRAQSGRWEVVVRENPVPGPVDGVVQNADGSYTVKGFRGTTAGRSPLDPGVGGSTFTTPVREMAENYAKSGKAAGDVAELGFTLKNPKVIDSFAAEARLRDLDVDEYIDELRGQGHDGLIIKTGHGGVPEVAAFEQSGVKVLASAADEAEAISRTYAHNEKLPLPADEELSMLQAVRQSIESGKNPFDADNLTNGVRFNFHYLGAPEGAKRILLAMEETYQKLFEKQVVPNKQTLKEAAMELTGSSTESRELVSRSLLDPALRGKLLARRAMLRAQSIYVNGLSEIVEREGGKNEDNILKLSQALQQMRNNALEVAETSSEAGRLLQSLQVDASDVAIGKGSKAEMAAQQAAGSEADPVVQANIEGFLSGKTPKEILLIARTLRMTDDPSAVGNIVRILGDTQGKPLPKKGSSKWDFLQSLRYNSMLSSSKTQIINAASNAFMTFARPLELMGSGALRGDRGALREGKERFISLASSMPEAWRMAKLAWKDGAPVLDATMRENMEKVEFDSWLAKAATLWNVPTKALMSSDEFFKNMNYSAAVRAQAVREGLSRGLDGAPLETFVKETMQASRTPEGRWLNEQAIEYAREGTFTRELSEGGVLTDIASRIEKDGPTGRFLRFVFPFIRTPTNIFLAATERTPVLWAFSKRMRDDLAAGGIRAAEAKAKLDMANLAFSSAALLAGSGMVSGGGPKRKDKLARDQKMSTGWKPYSIKVGDEWVSYQGLEPLSTILGTVADAQDINEALFASGTDAEKFHLAMAAGIVQNLSNKTFLQGIGVLEDILSGEPASIERALGNMARQVIPGSALLAETAYLSDPHFREARGLVEKIQAGIPAWNERLEPKRNVFGEPLMKRPVDMADRVGGGLASPFAVPFSERTDSQMLIAELQDDLGDQVKIPAINDRWKVGHTGKRLTDRSFWAEGSSRGEQSPFDRIAELMSEPDGKLVVGKTREPLPPVKDFIKLIRAENLDEMSKYVGRGKARQLMGWSGLREISGDDGTSHISVSDTRKYLLERAFTIYQNAAFEHARTEYPKLDKEIRRVEEVREAATDNRKSARRSSVRAFMDSGR